jgi:hypothetical protein
LRVLVSAFAFLGFTLLLLSHYANAVAAPATWNAPPNGAIVKAGVYMLRPHLAVSWWVLRPARQLLMSAERRCGCTQYITAAMSESPRVASAMLG